MTRDRLYREIARRMLGDFVSGKYDVGDRLPTERELAEKYGVSRPSIREATIALEVEGVVEVRIGSGTYLRTLPGGGDTEFDVSAFELTEARMLIEGEAAALAAAHISDEELTALDLLVDEIAQENERNSGTENADRRFHRTIAKATRNNAIVQSVENLWALRARSAPTALVHAKARAANIRPVIDEHRAIVSALRSRNSSDARNAMRAHLAAVLDSLLFATEERAIEKAKARAAGHRERYNTHFG